jgi:hypothetical protein
MMGLANAGRNLAGAVETYPSAAEGCPEAYDWAQMTYWPEPGWKCLQLWLSGKPSPGYAA